MQDKTSNSEPSTTKRKGSPETKSAGDARIFLTALLQLRAQSHPQHGVLWEKGHGKGLCGTALGAVPCRAQPVLSWALVEFLLGTEGQALLQPLSGPAMHRAVPAEKLQQKAVLHTCQMFDLDWRGKAVFSLSFLSPLNWDFYSLLGEMKNLFLFSIQKGFLGRSGF